jgi:hypothetical protein
MPVGSEPMPMQNGMPVPQNGMPVDQTQQGQSSVDQAFNPQANDVNKLFKSQITK